MPTTSDIALIKSLHLFSPHVQEKIVWDIFIGVLILFSVLATPFQISFEMELSSDLQTVLYVVDVLFFIDMLVTANTCYLSVNGTLVLSRRKIIQRYLKR